MLPSYGTSWPGEGFSEHRLSLLSRLARWLPPLLLSSLSLSCYAGVLIFVLLN